MLLKHIFLHNLYIISVFLQFTIQFFKYFIVINNQIVSPHKLSKLTYSENKIPFSENELILKTNYYKCYDECIFMSISGLYCDVFRLGFYFSVKGG